MDISMDISSIYASIYPAYMLAYMLAYMVLYEGVQIKFKLYFPLMNGAEMVTSLQSTSLLLMMNLMVMMMMTSTLTSPVRVSRTLPPLRATTPTLTCDNDMWHLKQHSCTCHYTHTHFNPTHNEYKWFASHLLFWSCGICFRH